jgi:hypothetical protein
MCDTLLPSAIHPNTGPSGLSAVKNAVSSTWGNSRVQLLTPARTRCPTPSPLSTDKPRGTSSPADPSWPPPPAKRRDKPRRAPSAGATSGSVDADARLPTWFAPIRLISPFQEMQQEDAREADESRFSVRPVLSISPAMFLVSASASFPARKSSARWGLQAQKSRSQSGLFAGMGERLRRPASPSIEYTPP